MKRLSVSHFANWADLVKLLGTWGTPVGKVELSEVAPGVQHIKLEADLLTLPGGRNETAESQGVPSGGGRHVSPGVETPPESNLAYQPRDEDIPF